MVAAPTHIGVEVDRLDADFLQIKPRRALRRNFAARRQVICREAIVIHAKHARAFDGV